MDAVQLPEGCIATTRRQFSFYHWVPRSSWYSFDWPGKDERLSRPWTHPMVLNLGPLDWESSALTTRLAVTLGSVFFVWLKLLERYYFIVLFVSNWRCQYCFYVSVLLRKWEWHKLGVWQKHSLNPCRIPIQNKGGKWCKFFILTLLLTLLCSSLIRWNLFKAPPRSIKICQKNNYFRILRTGRAIQIFSPMIFIYI